MAVSTNARSGTVILLIMLGIAILRMGLRMCVENRCGMNRWTNGWLSFKEIVAVVDGNSRKKARLVAVLSFQGCEDTIL